MSVNTPCPDCSGEGGDSYYGPCPSCLGSGEIPDPRVGPTAKAISRHALWAGASTSPLPTVQHRDEAIAALKAADAADREQGIIRVRVDDEAAKHIADKSGLSSWKVRRVLAALTGTEQDGS